MADEKLNVVVSVKDEASGKLNTIQNSLTKAGGASKAFAIGLAGAFTAAGIAMYSCVKAASDADVEMKKFNTTMNNVKGVTDEVKKSLLDAASGVTQFGFDDEEAANSLAMFYSRTKDVNQALELNQTAMDLARAKNIDLSTAASQVNMVLSGNGKVLKQYGIELTEGASPLQALGELHDKVKGQATAFAESLPGKIEILSQKYANLKEELGARLLPIFLTLADKILWFADTVVPDLIGKIESIIKWFAEHKEITIILAGAIVGALIPAFVGLVGVIWGLIAALGAAVIALAPFMIAGAVIAGVVLGILWLIQNWELVRSKTIEIFGAIGAFLEEIFASIGQWFSDLWNAFVTLVTESKLYKTIMKYWDDIKGYVFLVWDSLKLGFSALWDGFVQTITEIVDVLKPVWDLVWNTLYESLKIIFEQMKSWLISWFDWLKQKIEQAMSWIGDLAKSALKAGVSATPFGTVTRLLEKAEGGIVPQYFEAGGWAKGRDTVPAMLTPGELVLNKAQQRNLASQMGGVTINIMGNFVGSREEAERFGDMIMQKLKIHYTV